MPNSRAIAAAPPDTPVRTISKSTLVCLEATEAFLTFLKSRAAIEAGNVTRQISDGLPRNGPGKGGRSRTFSS
jgi:hypothetical protein